VAIEDWFHIPLPMQGIKSTSLAFASAPDITKDPYAGFCGEDDYGCHLELYPRPNGELYICGCGGSDYIEGDRLRAGGDSSDATKIHASSSRVEASLQALRAISSLGDATPSITQVSSFQSLLISYFFRHSLSGMHETVSFRLFARNG
jgi:hypothetical protein